MSEPNDQDRVVTVCSVCLTATCWHGEFYCDNHRKAGTVEKTVGELRQINAEHPSHYSVEKVREATGQEPRYRHHV